MGPKMDGTEGNGSNTVGSGKLDNAGAPNSGTLVFISHDARDADLAEAFSKLLKSVSAGMLKAYRSSDKKGTEGNEFGEDWYKNLMTKLAIASDVVCLFTERSVDRPWILYEAGIARAKLDTRVLGVALGVPLDRVNKGPFYHFQNCDGSEDQLTKLVLQLAERIPNAELDRDVVATQVKVFKATAEAILAKLDGPKAKSVKDAVEENPMAKLVEEMKSLVRDLPSRVAERMTDSPERIRRRRPQRYDPMMLNDLISRSSDPGDLTGFLAAVSLMREEFPWLYEVAMEAYRAIKAGDAELADVEILRMRRLCETMSHGHLAEEFAQSKESRMMLIDFAGMFGHYLKKALEYRMANEVKPRRAKQ